jgi:hypothetical protein
MILKNGNYLVAQFNENIPSASRRRGISCYTPKYLAII